MKIKLGAATLARTWRGHARRARGSGPAVRLRGDANGAWDRATARAALAALADFDFDYVEQPLAADDFEGMAQLHRDAPMRLAADESVATEAGALRLLATGAVDVVVLKPATLGGPARALEIAARPGRPASRSCSRTPSRARSAPGTHCIARLRGAIRPRCTACARRGCSCRTWPRPVECPGGLAEIVGRARARDHAVTGRHDLPWRAALHSGCAGARRPPAGTWTFADLLDRARRGAAYLRATAPPGDAPIALLLEGDADFAAWFHAVALAGRTVLPLNLRLTTGELAQQLADARVGVLLGEAGDTRLADLAAAAARPATPRRAAARRTARATRRRGRARAAPRTTATLAVLFTSGTSGRAKGACLSRANFLASAEAAADRLGPVVAERWLACMPLFHVGGLSILMRSVRFGGPVRLLPRFDAAEVSDALDAGDIAAVSLVPTMLSRLLAHRGGRPAPPGLRVLLLGGAAAAPELLTRALAAGYPVCPDLRTDRGCVAGRDRRAAAGRRDAAPPMRPLRGTELRIVSDGRDAPPGTPGEIVVRGPTVMQGYLHDPQSTARALRDGWLSHRRHRLPRRRRRSAGARSARRPDRVGRRECLSG